MDKFTIFHLYLIFFLIGLGYAFISLAMGHLLGGGAGGGDHDFDHHDIGHGKMWGHSGTDSSSHDHGSAASVSTESMPNISAWSPVTIATFVTTFGGTGIILDQIGLPTLVSFPVAGISGLGIAAAVFYLFHRVFSITQSTSGVTVRQAMGREAQVITAIPQHGVGEIAYVLGGRRFNAPARTEDGHPIAVRTSVVIERRTGGTFYVRELPTVVLDKK